MAPRNRLTPFEWRPLGRLLVEAEKVSLNPTAGLKLPAVAGHRARIVNGREAEALLAAADVLASRSSSNAWIDACKFDSCRGTSHQRASAAR